MSKPLPPFPPQQPNGDIEFTRTQKRILDRLSDGKLHRVEELIDLLDVDLGDKETVAVHITALRKLLRKRGENILSRNVGTYWVYWWVRSIYAEE
jgi:hypothetical protein